MAPLGPQRSAFIERDPKGQQANLVRWTAEGKISAAGLLNIRLVVR